MYYRIKVIEKRSGTIASIGFEEKLWQAADKLRGSMDASEYKSVVLGLIFLKYVSDSFEEKYEVVCQQNIRQFL